VSGKLRDGEIIQGNLKRKSRELEIGQKFSDPTGTRTRTRLPSKCTTIALPRPTTECPLISGEYLAVYFSTIHTVINQSKHLQCSFSTSPKRGFSPRGLKKLLLLDFRCCFHRHLLHLSTDIIWIGLSSLFRS
jgi:hypothetical protein